MKEEPPQPNRRMNDASFEGQLLRRVQMNVSLILGSAFVALWLLTHPSGDDNGLIASAIPGPMGGPFVILTAIFAAIVLNGFFIAAVSALELLKPLHLRSLKEERKQSKLQKILDQKQIFIAACTLGSQAARFLMALIGFLVAVNFWPSLASRLQWGQPDYVYLLLSAVIVAIPITLVNIILGELVPKSYASLHPHSVVLALYRFMQVSAFLFAWPAKLMMGLANVFAARFGGHASFAVENQAEEEIKTLVDSAEETGEIEAGEKELLHSVFEFSDTIAREVMTPRVDLDAMPVGSDPAEVIRLIQESGHSRIPLYDGTDDQIVGIVHAKDLLMAAQGGTGSLNIRRLMRPALFVPENKSLRELLSEMRIGRTQLAVVQDEFGGTAGIVTIEDIVEELVGDIVDEYDVEEAEIIQTAKGISASGKAHLDDVNEILKSEFESEEFDTIGGFLFGLFGRQPKQYEEIEAEGFCFRVSETDGRRIVRMEIERAPEPVQNSVAETAEQA